MPERNSVVLDSFALIGYLENETFSSRVETILKQAREDKRLIYLHAIHLGEVYEAADHEARADEEGEGERELAHDQPGFPDDFAAIDLELARDQFKCRRLACTVPTDQANAFAGFNCNVRLCQDLLVAEFQRHFFKANERH